MNHKQRILMAARGEMPDLIPYVPRIDLWYNANSLRGTLPAKHEGKTRDQISLDEGWALHKVVADHVRQPHPEAILHRALGVQWHREYAAWLQFGDETDIKIKRDGDRTKIHYTTPKGSITTTTVYNEEMKKSGTSIPWTEEHAIKTPEDILVLASIFERMDVVPNYDSFLAYQNEVGDNGVAVTCFTVAASPMHHIQKYLLDATDFFFHYRDNHKEMRILADALAPLYNKAIEVMANSPAEIIHWGANFDDMITYAPYFEKEFLPWIQKAKQALEPKDILVLCHTDGENLGLMDLIKNSGTDVAEAVCPAPMTKVSIQDYYRQWSDSLTIFGGVPSNLLISQITPEDEFKSFMENLFTGIAPGSRFIMGIADTTPPDAEFERLVRLGDMAREKGRLPLEAGSYNPVLQDEAPETNSQLPIQPFEPVESHYTKIQEDVLKGKNLEIIAHVQELLDKGTDAQEIVDKGMVAAMEIINQNFKNGTVFIPEVLQSARAMNQAVEYLEPHLTKGENIDAGSKVLIGTVKGDLHDIGKNIVSAMLRGVGFKVIDLGINIPVDEFVSKVKEEGPGVVALSALLTTTMSQMKLVIDALTEAGLRDKVGIIVGGAPLNQNFADDIGADGYAKDAPGAVDLVRTLITAYSRVELTGGI